MILREEVRCRRCGSDMAHTDCPSCQDSVVEALSYDGDYEPCETCGGEGGWWFCLATSTWCQANPLPGREAELRSTPEFFEVPA